jgi:hypothetical protein
VSVIILVILTSTWTKHFSIRRRKHTRASVIY